MAINLYRRHRAECEAGRPEQFRSGEFEERKKGWKRCACHIHASGTLNGKFSRKSTGLTDWDQARELTAGWKSWNGELLIPSEPPPASPSRDRITIEKAVREYKSELADSHAMTTIRGYGYLLTELQDFSLSRGYVYIDQWQPFDVREFRTSWGVKISTATKKMATVKAFFRYLESNRWLKENPANLLKEKHTRKEREGENAPRIPFSDDDLTKMFSACASQYATKGNYRRRWDGQDLADFIAISVYTGLRISDVATFHVDRLKENGECRIRTTKGGNHVSTWIPVWLQERIRGRAKEHGGLIFGSHQTKDICVITDVWRRKLDKLWALCGPWTTNPTHHRCRHTFARILLQRGVSVQDVAELLGNTEKVVRKHYAEWVPERQARLTEILQKAFADKPKPNVIAFPGRG